MGVPSDDVVLIQKGKNPGEPYILTVNCPDKTGLGCDICRIILDFGLHITKGDISTDGIWCYIVLWVVPHSSSVIVKWSSLKNRMQSVCPSCLPTFYFNEPSTSSSISPVYLLKFFCVDRRGLLNDVTQVLCELELTIQRVKVTTTPDDRVLDLFFVTDNRDLLHTKDRQNETLEQLHAVLGESCITCELQLAGPECERRQGISSLSPVVAEELFRCELSDKEIHSQALSPDMTKLKNANVTVDNSLSPAHTLLQIHCADHKGLLYDIMRTLKDCSIQIAYGRFTPTTNGYCDLDLFIQQNGGKKILDLDKQNALCSRLKVEMLHPLRVIIVNRGPDTELLVANPVELSGKGRPRVFYDVTLALKSRGICIFSAEIGRHSASDREWEVYSFLLDESCSRFQLSNMVARNQIVDRVRRTLMGW
ncbi:ACT domain-containing protein ACR9-like [Humulus lupulus]|uniref:ACT domain-containing protein ACR9-like n=1 Tax=Humulus lupulus TaxID=3486 RepID=UPI002B407787|nr:ACT domain-containing protein ACR9-like [Humulus lupulus]